MNPGEVELARTVCGQEIRFRTHQRPDLDEIYSVHLIQEHATPEWLNQHARWGTILIGIGGGEFDEHPQNGSERKALCSATLVAQSLGVADDPGVARVLRLVEESDTKPVPTERDFSRIVKLFHRAHPDQPEVAVRWATMAIVAMEGEQRQFVTEAKAEFERSSFSVSVSVPGSRDLIITVVRSDNEQMNAFARSKLGSRADVVIQRNSTGHTQIHCRLSREFDRGFFLGKFRELIRVLRIEEARAKGIVLRESWDELECGGTCGPIGAWYFMEEGPTILNGSVKHCAKPATLLECEAVELSVIEAFDVTAFEPDREESCRKGVCNSPPANPCPWFKRGLYRCRAIRERQWSRRGAGRGAAEAGRKSVRAKT